MSVWLGNGTTTNYNTNSSYYETMREYELDRTLSRTRFELQDVRKSHLAYRKRSEARAEALLKEIVELRQELDQMRRLAIGTLLQTD